MPKNKPAKDSDSENEASDNEASDNERKNQVEKQKQLKQKSKESNNKGNNSSKLKNIEENSNSIIENTNSISEEIDYIKKMIEPILGALKRIDSSSLSEGPDNILTEYIDKKFDELKDLIIQNKPNSNNSDNSEDEKPKSSKKETKSKKKQAPRPHNIFITFKSEKKPDIDEFIEDKYPDHECFGPDDEKCEKNKKYSKATAYLFGQLDESEKEELNQISLANFKKKHGFEYNKE
jgi:hypothetical protein